MSYTAQLPWAPQLLLYWLLLVAACSNSARADGSPPVIVVHPSSIYIPLSQAKTLTCRAAGSPAPRITWYKDGVRVVTQRDDPGSYYEVVAEGDLLLLRAQRHHFGQYYCNATNEYGYAISNNATVSMAYLQEEFRRLPEDVSVVAGREAQFLCQPPSGAPQPQLKWHIRTSRRQDFWYPPQPLAAGSSAAGSAAASGSNLRRFSLDPATGTLTISSVHKSDSGEYKCVAYNEVGEKPSVPARLTIWEKPFISEPPVHMIVNQGQDAKFRCLVVGDPTPTVRWLKNGVELDGGGAAPVAAGSGGRSIVMPDSSLVVRSVLPSDEGSYSCMATNEGGMAEAAAHLTVNTPPRFLLEPFDKAAAIGKSVLFHCIADGSPPPSVYWQKQVQTGEQMFPRHSYSSGKFSVSDGGILRIDNVQLDDEGDYICHALNNAGQANASARLRVRDLDDLKPPVIIEGPSNVTAQMSSSVVLHCRASGSPLPVVRWQKNGRPLAASARFTINQGSLRIVDVYVTDSGMYTCFVSSESGEATASAQLTVVGMHNSVVTSHVPSPPGKPYATSIFNAIVMLAWTAGEPRSSQAVVQDSYAVEMFSYAEEKGWTRGSFERGSMRSDIRNLLPGNDYVFLIRCQNEFGTSEGSPLSDIIRTTGEAVPSNRPARRLMETVEQALTKSAVVQIRPPQVISSTSINVSWTIMFPNKTPYIEGFYIRMSSVRGQNVEQVYSSFSTYKRITNLHPNTVYQFSVAPFYYNVPGTPSDIAEARTLEDVPSGPPRNVRVSRDGNRVLVNWEPVLEEHSSGMLVGYLVSWIATDRTSSSQNITVNATTTRLLVESLRPDMTYQLSVAAYTRVGVGVASSSQQLAALYPPGSYADGQQGQSLVDEPWFLPTVIGIIGLTLCVVLFTLVVCVCVRRRAARRQAKKDSTNGIISVPLENMPKSPQIYVAYQTDTTYRPTTPRSGGPRPSQTSDSVSRSASNANMSNKVDDYNLDGSEGSQCQKTFYNKTATTTDPAASDLGGMGLYATTCLLGLSKGGQYSADAAMPAFAGAASASIRQQPQQLFQQMPCGVKVGGGSSESSCTDNNGRPGSSSGGSTEQAQAAASAASCPHHGCPCGSGSGGAMAAGAGVTRDSPPGLPHFADILPPPPRYPPPPGSGMADGYSQDAACQQPLMPSLAYQHQHSAPTMGTLAGGGGYCHHCGSLAGGGGVGSYPAATLSAMPAVGHHNHHPLHHHHHHPHGQLVDGSGGSMASSASSGGRRTMPPAQLHRGGSGSGGPPAVYGASDYASCRDTYPHPYSTFGSQRSGGGGSSGRSCHDYAEPEFLDTVACPLAPPGGGLSMVPQHFAAGSMPAHAGCCQAGCNAGHAHGGGVGAGGHWDRPPCCAACESAEYDEPWGEHHWGEHPWPPLAWAAGAAGASGGGGGPVPVHQPMHEHFGGAAAAAAAAHRLPLASSSSGRAPGLMVPSEHLLAAAAMPATASVVALREAEEDDWRAVAAAARGDADADEDDADVQATEELLPLRSSCDDDEEPSSPSSGSDDGDGVCRRSADSKERKGRVKKRSRERQRAAATASAAATRGRPTSPYQGYSTDSSFVFVPRKPYPKADRKKQIQRQQQQQPRSSVRRDMSVQAEGDELRDRV